MLSELVERIVVDPQVCFGKPTIRGHRIWVSLVLDHLAAGRTPAEIVEEFEGLVADDVLACLAHAARLADVGFRRPQHGVKPRVRSRLAIRLAINGTELTGQSDIRRKESSNHFGNHTDATPTVAEGDEDMNTASEAHRSVPQPVPRLASPIHHRLTRHSLRPQGAFEIAKFGLGVGAVNTEGSWIATPSSGRIWAVH